MTKPYPWFYAVNDRPVQIVQLPNGGADCLVLDMATGNLVPDRSYFEKVVPGSGKDVDELSASEFSRRVAQHRASLVRTFAERMCQAAGGSEQDMLAVLGVPLTPPPLGAIEATIRGGEVGLAKLELQLARASVPRAELDARLGAARTLPRSGANRSHVLAYDVAVAGAPCRVSVFVTFDEAPIADSSAQSVLLRLDRAAG